MTARFGPLVWAALAMLLLAGPAPAQPEDPNYPAARCEAAIVNGARRGGVPPEVLQAVALTETGRRENGRLRPWPWAINREGQGFWFKTEQEAIAFAQESLAAGRTSFDVGCVQINYRWHGRAFPSLEQMFDPDYTATYAAQFLRNLYEERGNWSEAAGAYHSLTPGEAAVYRKRFDAVLAEIEPGSLPDAETLLASAPRLGATGSRAARREAQRRAIAEAIAKAGPPPDPVMGSIATVLGRADGGSGVLLTHGTPLLSQGAPLLGEAKPLLTAPAGGLF